MLERFKSLIDTLSEQNIEHAEQLKKFTLYLIKPSKYDDEGYPIRYKKGVLPSNTLTVLSTYSDFVQINDKENENIPFENVTCDDTVQEIPYEEIIQKSKTEKVAVALVGVQTNQFPRAVDIAEKLISHGIPVLIGGFHVSGLIVMSDEYRRKFKPQITSRGEPKEDLPVYDAEGFSELITPEMKELLDKGETLVLRTESRLPGTIAIKHKDKEVKIPVYIRGFQSHGLIRKFVDHQREKNPEPLYVHKPPEKFTVYDAQETTEFLPEEMQVLLERGITLVKGEVEETMEDIMNLTYQGKARGKFIDITHAPELKYAPLPMVNREYLRHFAAPLQTLDTSRGCPFRCSFCTIINVQGRKMRMRSVEKIKCWMRENYSQGINYYFFTDDNFCRNKDRITIFETLIELKNEGIDVSFMMQVDAKAYKIPGFLEKAKAAGCTQVFIGIESVNEKNLEQVGKKQNKKENYVKMMRAYADVGIKVHLSYIIGFPHDTEDSVLNNDLPFIMDEMKPGQMSFFILIPLPGSVDHMKALKEGTICNDDYNDYDGYGDTLLKHPNMTREEWLYVFDECWKRFYSKENMIKILSRSNNPKEYWDIFNLFLWYKNSVDVQDNHPMASGFIGTRDYSDVRPGSNSAAYSKPRHLYEDCKFQLSTLKKLYELICEMFEVYMKTKELAGIDYDEEEFREVMKNVILDVQKGIEFQELERKYGQALQDTRFQIKKIFDDSKLFDEDIDLLSRPMQLARKLHASLDYLHEVFYKKFLFKGNKVKS